MVRCALQSEFTAGTAPLGQLTIETSSLDIAQQFQLTADNRSRCINYIDALTALSRTTIQEMLCNLYGLAAEGKTNSRGAPNVLQMALIANHYRDEFVLASPPRSVQTCIFGILAPLARLFGYSATIR